MPGVFDLEEKSAAQYFLDFLSMQPAFGQAGSVDLTGTVSDNAGGVLTTAKITITENQTGASTSTSTTTGGVYVFTNLRPGVYTVVAEAEGFQALARTGVTLITGERTRVDMTMAVGSVAEAHAAISLQLDNLASATGDEYAALKDAQKFLCLLEKEESPDRRPRLKL
jgi:hypothetical protein